MTEATSNIIAAAIQAGTLFIVSVLGFILVLRINHKRFKAMNYNQSNVKLCNDWLIFDTQRRMLIEEIAKLKNENESTLLKQYNKLAEKKEQKHISRYSDKDVKKILEHIEYNSKKNEMIDLM